MTALLLSGGLDSAAIAWWKRPDICVFVNYGQIPAKGERNAAKNIAESINSKFIEIEVDCSNIGSGSLANKKELSIAPAKEWWPFRNQLLITIASAKLLEFQVSKIYFGSVKTDEFHADGRKEFFELINNLLRFQEGTISVEAPATNLRTEELVKLSEIPENLLLATHSCHINNFACGNCSGCVKHYAVLKMLSVGY